MDWILDSTMDTKWILIRLKLATCKWRFQSGIFYFIAVEYIYELERLV